MKWSGIFAQKAMKGNHEDSTWWEKELFLNVDAAVNEKWNVHAGIDTKWGTNDNGLNGEEEFSDAYGAHNHKVSNMLAREGRGVRLQGRQDFDQSVWRPRP